MVVHVEILMTPFTGIGSHNRWWPGGEEHLYLNLENPKVSRDSTIQLTSIEERPARIIGVNIFNINKTLTNNEMRLIGSYLSAIQRFVIDVSRTPFSCSLIIIIFVVLAVVRWKHVLCHYSSHGLSWKIVCVYVAIRHKENLVIVEIPFINKAVEAKQKTRGREDLAPKNTSK